MNVQEPDMEWYGKIGEYGSTPQPTNSKAYNGKLVAVEGTLSLNILLPRYRPLLLFTIYTTYFVFLA